MIGKLNEMEEKALEEGGFGMAEKEVTLNQIAVMIEKVGSDVKAVAEGHQVIRREMQEMRGELLFEINFVKSALKTVAEKVNKIDKTLDEHVKLPAHV